MHGVCDRYSTFQPLPLCSVRRGPDSVCDKLTRQGTMGPSIPVRAARLSTLSLLLEDAQYLLSGRACHPHACGACPSASCAGKAALSALRVHCIDAAADQLPLPLQISTTRWKSAPSSLQSVLSWDLMVLLHKSLCTYHSAICVAGKAAGPGTHGGQQTLKNMTGSLFESNNHLSQHNIVKLLKSTVKILSQIYIKHVLLQ